MFELGEESNQSINLSRNASEWKWSQMLFYWSYFIIINLKSISFINIRRLSIDLATNALIDNTILIKGSRGMALERTLDFIPDDFVFSQYFRKVGKIVKNRLIILL
jgi:UDP-N-acetylmuramoyl-tripeptide--D-alanyl-D-alanine ligase